MFPCEQVDWDGKVALIQCAKAMGIQKFVFFSIHNCEKHPEVPLMEIKRCTEKYIADSGLNYTIVRLCGFMQVKIRELTIFFQSWEACKAFGVCPNQWLMKHAVFQGLIGQYAVPILEDKSVWGTDASTRIAYMDTQVPSYVTM